MIFNRYVLQAVMMMSGEFKIKLETWLVDFLETSPLNQLPEEYGRLRFFGKPIIGIADGHDPLFEKYKEIISPDYMTPAELWKFSEKGHENENLRVVSIVFPFVKKIKDANARASPIPTETYCLSRNHANELINTTLKNLINFCEMKGYDATAGILSEKYNITIKESFFSNWSERHVAFAAGLGTFSLHEAFITDVGCNIRLGSIVTNAPLPVSNRIAEEPYANCIFYAKGKESCGKCIDRCPAGAITPDGHDKWKCWMHGQKIARKMAKTLKPYLKPHHRRLNWIYSPTSRPPVGCALCQFGVPCTETNPMAPKKNHS